MRFLSLFLLLALAACSGSEERGPLNTDRVAQGTDLGLNGYPCKKDSDCQAPPDYLETKSKAKCEPSAKVCIGPAPGWAFGGVKSFSRIYCASQQIRMNKNKTWVCTVPNGGSCTKDIECQTCPSDGPLECSQNVCDVNLKVCLPVPASSPSFKLPDGARCQENLQCSSDKCTAVKSRDTNGTCLTSSKNACNKNSDCASGYCDAKLKLCFSSTNSKSDRFAGAVCESGKNQCGAGNCSDGTCPAVEFARCSSDANCKGLAKGVCNFMPNNGGFCTVEASRTGGTTCTEDAQCTANKEKSAKCSNGKCLAATNQFCKFDSNCLSGQCNFYGTKDGLKINHTCN